MAARTYADLRALVLEKFIINQRAVTNPLVLPNGNERWYIITPTQATVQTIVQNALTNSGLPYAVVQVCVYSEAGAFIEFKPVKVGANDNGY